MKIICEKSYLLIKPEYNKSMLVHLIEQGLIRKAMTKHVKYF